MRESQTFAGRYYSASVGEELAGRYKVEASSELCCRVTLFGHMFTGFGRRHQSI